MENGYDLIFNSRINIDWDENKVDELGRKITDLSEQVDLTKFDENQRKELQQYGINSISDLFVQKNGMFQFSDSIKQLGSSVIPSIVREVQTLGRALTDITKAEKTYSAQMEADSKTATAYRTLVNSGSILKDISGMKFSSQNVESLYADALRFVSKRFNQLGHKDNQSYSREMWADMLTEDTRLRNQISKMAKLRNVQIDEDKDITELIRQGTVGLGSRTRIDNRRALFAPLYEHKEQQYDPTDIFGNKHLSALYKKDGELQGKRFVKATNEAELEYSKGIYEAIIKLQQKGNRIAQDLAVETGLASYSEMTQDEIEKGKTGHDAGLVLRWNKDPEGDRIRKLLGRTMQEARKIRSGQDIYQRNPDLNRNISKQFEEILEVTQAFSDRALGEGGEEFSKRFIEAADANIDLKNLPAPVFGKVISKIQDTAGRIPTYGVPYTSVSRNGDQLVFEPRTQEDMQKVVKSTGQLKTRKTDKGILLEESQLTHLSGVNKTGNNPEKPILVSMPVSDMWERDEEGFLKSGKEKKLTKEGEMQKEAISKGVTYNGERFRYVYTNGESATFMREKEYLEKIAEAKRKGIDNPFEGYDPTIAGLEVLTRNKETGEWESDLSKSNKMVISAKRIATQGRALKDIVGESKQDKIENMKYGAVSLNAQRWINEQLGAETVGRLVDGAGFIDPSLSPFSFQARGLGMGFKGVLGNYDWRDFLRKTVKASPNMKKSPFIKFDENGQLSNLYMPSVAFHHLEEEDKKEVIRKLNAPQAGHKTRDKLLSEYFQDVMDPTLGALIFDEQLKTPSQMTVKSAEDYINFITGERTTETDDEWNAKVADAQARLKAKRSKAKGTQTMSYIGADGKEYIRLNKEETAKNIAESMKFGDGLFAVKSGEDFSTGKRTIGQQVAEAIGFSPEMKKRSAQLFAEQLDKMETDDYWINEEQFSQRADIRNLFEQAEDKSAFLRENKQAREYIQSQKDALLKKSMTHYMLDDSTSTELAFPFLGSFWGDVLSLTGATVDKNSDLAWMYPQMLQSRDFLKNKFKLSDRALDKITPIENRDVLNKYGFSEDELLGIRTINDLKTAMNEKGQVIKKADLDQIRQKEKVNIEQLMFSEDSDKLWALAGRTPASINTFSRMLNLAAAPRSASQAGVRGGGNLRLVSPEGIYRMNTGDFDGDTIMMYAHANEQMFKDLEKINASAIMDKETQKEIDDLFEQQMAELKKKTLEPDMGGKVSEELYNFMSGQGEMGKASAIMRNALDLYNMKTKKGRESFMKAYNLGSAAYDKATSEGQNMGWVGNYSHRFSNAAYLAGRQFSRFQKDVSDDYTRPLSEKEFDSHQSIFKNRLLSLNNMAGLASALEAGKLRQGYGLDFGFGDMVDDWIANKYGESSKGYNNVLFDVATQWGDILKGQYDLSYLASNKDLEKFFELSIKNLRVESANAEDGSDEKKRLESEIKNLERSRTKMTKGSGLGLLTTDNLDAMIAMAPENSEEKAFYERIKRVNALMPETEKIIADDEHQALIEGELEKHREARRKGTTYSADTVEGLFEYWDDLYNNKNPSVTAKEPYMREPPVLSIRKTQYDKNGKLINKGSDNIIGQLWSPKYQEQGIAADIARAQGLPVPGDLDTLFGSFVHDVFSSTIMEDTQKGKYSSKDFLKKAQETWDTGGFVRGKEKISWKDAFTGNYEGSKLNNPLSEEDWTALSEWLKDTTKELPELSSLDSGVRQKMLATFAGKGNNNAYFLRDLFKTGKLFEAENEYIDPKTGRVLPSQSVVPEPSDKTGKLETSYRPDLIWETNDGWLDMYDWKPNEEGAGKSIYQMIHYAETARIAAAEAKRKRDNGETLTSDDERWLKYLDSNGNFRMRYLTGKDYTGRGNDISFDYSSPSNRQVINAVMGEFATAGELYKADRQNKTSSPLRGFQLLFDAGIIKKDEKIPSALGKYFANETTYGDIEDAINAYRSNPENIAKASDDGGVFNGAKFIEKHNDEWNYLVAKQAKNRESLDNVINNVRGLGSKYNTRAAANREYSSLDFIYDDIQKLKDPELIAALSSVYKDVLPYAIQDIGQYEDERIAQEKFLRNIVDVASVQDPMQAERFMRRRLYHSQGSDVFGAVEQVIGQANKAAGTRQTYKKPYADVLFENGVTSREEADAVWDEAGRIQQELDAQNGNYATKKGKKAKEAYDNFVANLDAKYGFKEKDVNAAAFMTDAGKYANAQEYVDRLRATEAELISQIYADDRKQTEDTVAALTGQIKTPEDLAKVKVDKQRSAITDYIASSQLGIQETDTNIDRLIRSFTSEYAKTNMAKIQDATSSGDVSKINALMSKATKEDAGIFENIKNLMTKKETLQAAISTLNDYLTDGFDKFEESALSDAKTQSQQQRYHSVTEANRLAEFGELANDPRHIAERTVREKFLSGYENRQQGLKEWTNLVANNSQAYETMVNMAMGANTTETLKTVTTPPIQNTQKQLETPKPIITQAVQDTTKQDETKEDEALRAKEAEAQSQAKNAEKQQKQLSVSKASKTISSALVALESYSDELGYKPKDIKAVSAMLSSVQGTVDEEGLQRVISSTPNAKPMLKQLALMSSNKDIQNAFAPAQYNRKNSLIEAARQSIEDKEGPQYDAMRSRLTELQNGSFNAYVEYKSSGLARGDETKALLADTESRLLREKEASKPLSQEKIAEEENRINNQAVQAESDANEAYQKKLNLAEQTRSFRLKNIEQEKAKVNEEYNGYRDREQALYDQDQAEYDKRINDIAANKGPKGLSKEARNQISEIKKEKATNASMHEANLQEVERLRNQAIEDIPNQIEEQYRKSNEAANNELAADLDKKDKEAETQLAELDKRRPEQKDEMFDQAKSYLMARSQERYGYSADKNRSLAALESINNRQELIDYMASGEAGSADLRKIFSERDGLTVKNTGNEKLDEYFTAIDNDQKQAKRQSAQPVQPEPVATEKPVVQETLTTQPEKPITPEELAEKTPVSEIPATETAQTQNTGDAVSKAITNATEQAAEQTANNLQIKPSKPDSGPAGEIIGEKIEDATIKSAEEVRVKSDNESKPGGPNEPEQPAPQQTKEEYEAAYKTAQYAQNVRDQLKYFKEVGGENLENLTPYERQVYDRLNQYNPDTDQGKAGLANVNQEFLDRAQINKTFQDMSYQNRIDSIEARGDLAVEKREAGYQQYAEQRKRRGSRSRAASYYMQDYNRHRQLGLERDSMMQQEKEAKADIAALRVKREGTTGEDRDKIDKQIGEKEANLGKLQKELKSVNEEYGKFNEKTAAGDAAMDSFQQSVGMVATRLGRQVFRKVLNETKQFIKQFDKSMTEIQMITLKSDTQIDQLGSKLIDVAKNTGSTVTEVTSAASNLYRQGLSDEEVDERLDDVIKFSKVSGIKTTEASKIITTAMQNGLVGNSTEAMDALVALGDSAATTASEIAKGMQKSAAAAKQSGMSYGELVTLLTIGTSKTQLGGSTIGSSLNTLMYRLYKVNNGEDFYDENGNHISSTAASKALSHMGVDLYDENGSFRGPYQILQDIASNWENADDTTQSMILTTLGAGRQRSNIATLLQGMAADDGELAQKYLDTAEGSKGITDRKYDEYLDSLEAKTNTLKSSWDELVSGFSGGEMAKGGIDFVTTLVQGFTTFNELLGGAPGLIMGVVAAVGVLAAVVTAFGANPVFLAMLPYIGAIAGLAGAAIGVGALVNNITNSDKRKKEEQAQYVEKTKTEASNYVSARNAKETEYKNHLSAMEALIEERKKNPEQWTDENAKEFNTHVEALSNSMLDVEFAAGDAASSIETMSAAARAASGAIQSYKAKTFEQALIMLQTVFDDIRQKTKDRNDEINSEYNGLVELSSSNVRGKQAKNVLEHAEKFEERYGADIIKGGIFQAGSSAPPELKTAIDQLNSTGKVNPSADGKIHIQGKTFQSQQEFMQWLFTGEAHSKYGVNFSTGLTSQMASTQPNSGISELFEGMSDKTYNDTYAPFLISAFKTPGAVDQYNDPFLIEALMSVYHGSADEFAEDAKNKFAKLFAYKGKKGTSSYAGTLAVARLIEFGDSVLSGELQDSSGNPYLAGILDAAKQKTDISNRTGWEQQLDAIQGAGFQTDLSAAEEDAIINWLVNNGYDSTDSNSSTTLTRAINALNANKAQFVSDNASEEYLPVKWQTSTGATRRYESVDKALEDVYSIDIKNGTYDPNSSKVRETKAAIQRANGITSGTAVEEGLLAYENARDQKAKLASGFFEGISSTQYDGGIHNLKQLFDAVDEAQVDNFTELLKTFPELAKMLEDFVEFDQESGRYKVKDEVAESEALYGEFIKKLTQYTDEHKNDFYVSNSQKAQIASDYFAGINTTEDAYSTFGEVIGSEKLAQKYRSAVYNARQKYFNDKLQWQYENPEGTEEDFAKEYGQIYGPLGYGVDQFELDYINAKQNAYANGMSTISDEDRLGLLTQVQQHLSANQSEIDYDWLNSIEPDTLSQITNGYTDFLNVLRNPDASPEDVAKAMEQFNAQFASDKATALMKYKNTLDDMPDILKMISKGGFDASKGQAQLKSELNKLQNQTTALKNAQFQNGEWKSGKQIKAEKNGSKYLEILGEMINRSAAELEEYSAEDMQDMFGGAQSRINEVYSNTLQSMVQQAIDTAQADNPEVEINLADIAAVVNGEMDLSNIEGAIGEQAARILEQVLSLQGTYGQGKLVISQNGETFTISAEMDASKLHKTGGGGGGGGKSAVDKLLEKQKHRMAELEHQNKMLQTEEKTYDYRNDYSGWNNNIEDQINLQYRLSEAYKLNIKEMENLLARTKKGSDDWYKLKESIYSAEEAMKETINTINELNAKKINILADEFEESDKKGTHKINMLDKYAQRAMDEDRYNDYIRFTNQKITETQAQRSANNTEIAKWKEQLAQYEKDSDSWREIRDKIWALEEENADLDNQVVQMQLELGQQKLSQIAKVVQQNTQTATHNQNLASTFAGVYESQGYRKNYEEMVVEQMKANEVLIAENEKAKKSTQEQMKTLKNGSTAWFEAQAAMYQYDEAVAQAQVSQMELNHALEESKMQNISETYTDWTRDLLHVNNLLEEQASLYRENNDTEAQKKATEMIVANYEEIISARRSALEALQYQYDQGMELDLLDPSMQRALLDEINTAEEELQKLMNDQLRKQREADKIDLDAMLADQSWEASQYSHNQQLLGYQTTKYQNAGELTNYGTMLEASQKMNEERVEVIDEELDALNDLAKYYRETYGAGTEEEKQITEQIMKHEEERAKLNTEYEKTNKLIEENINKIRKVRKALEDSVDKEIEDREKHQREVLSANVSLQETIVNLLKQRLQKEWNLKKKDIEKEKEALNEYKKLINERYNYRKKASEKADKEEELANYKKQLALIEADPTQTKAAKELRRKIADLEKENSWNLAEEELNAENERIDEELTGMDKFVQYNEELLNEILGDANNFATEMNTILTGSFEESYKNILKFYNDYNEAFIKSLPAAQQQMIQSIEDTAKKAYDIFHTNYAEITDVLYDEDGNLRSEEDVLNWYKENDYQYKGYMEAGDMLNAQEMEQIWRDAYRNAVAALKTGAEFIEDVHDLGEVETQADELDSSIYQVDTQAITGEPLYSPTFDNSGVTSQDFSNYMSLVLENLDNIYKVIEPETPAPAASSDSPGKGNKPATKKVKYWTVYNSGKTYTFYDEQSAINFRNNALSSAKATAGYAYSNIKDAEERNKKINEYLNKTVGSVVPHYKHGGLVDYTGPAWVDGSKQRPEAFLNADDTALLRSMLDAYNKIQYTPTPTYIDPLAYGDTTNVGDINITINAAEFKSDEDYDKVARRVGQAFTRELKRSGLNLSGYAF